MTISTVLMLKPVPFWNLDPTQIAKIGAPVDLLQCIKHTSKEKTRELMAHCDFAIATGGAALVRVVYEAGKPAHTVGAGNVVSVVDSTADLAAAAKELRV